MADGKIGVLTMFYGSKNYGGCLQAYALVKYLEENGYAAEQINYKKETSAIGNNIKRISSQNVFVIYEKVKRRIRRQLQRRVQCSDFSVELLRQREKAFDDFRREYVPSSAAVYGNANIAGALKDYRAFVVGSDQVWNEVTEDSPYLLGFVRGGPLKLSYAASIAQDTLSDYTKRVFAKALGDFNAVSVREVSTAGLLAQAVGRPVEWVLDPTLLIPADTWAGLCAPPLVEGRYLFCYFLGDNKHERVLAREYAKAQGLTLVTLPYLLGKPCKCDEHFGDVQLWDVSPLQFLSLIRHAECVFADSLHACVFSYIFKRQFFAFKRIEGRTNARLYSLLHVFSALDRFLDTREKQTLAYLQRVPALSYSAQPPLLADRTAASKAFLQDHLFGPLEGM